MHLVAIHNLKYCCSTKKEESIIFNPTLFIPSYEIRVYYFCIMMVMQFDKISD